MKRTDIFHNASLKLSVTYLLIIMIISSMFSVVVFRVSSDELEQSINRPLVGAERRLLQSEGLGAITELAEERAEEINEAKQRLINRLIVINMIILVAGGGGSYILARKTLKPIEKAHEAQSRFTADASHELRTPITAIRAETELAITDPKLTLKAAKEQLSSNIEELDKLTSLSEGLLQLARMDTDLLETASVSIDHLIAQSVERIDTIMRAKQQKLTLPKPTDLRVNVHQASIVEAIVTILDNASKYSPDKSSIAIRITSNKSSVSIAIKDNGAGIKSSELPHIFDRFYRADSSRTSN